MPGKSLKKFCKITQWIEQNDEPLAIAIRAMCMERGFFPRRSTGVTFVYPSAAVRKEIVAAVYSADPAAAEQLINAHLIYGALTTPAEFKECGSKLGILLEAKSTDAKSVTLANGAKISPVPGFVPLRENKIAVWRVDSGSMPLEGKEYVPAFKRDRAAKVGGGPASSRRVAMGEKVAAEYDACMRSGSHGVDPYLACTVSLLNFLKSDCPDHLAAVLPFLDRDPCTSFYLLVEPYTTNSSSCLLPDEVLFGPRGWNCAEIFSSPVSEFGGFLDAAAACLQGDSAAIRGAIDRVRVHITGVDGRAMNAVRTPKAVQDAYVALGSHNTIDGAGPVLPPASLARVPGLKKLWQDELRFVLHAAMSHMRARAYSPDSFKSVLNMLRFDRPGNNYAAEASLSSAEQLLKNVSPKAEFNLLIRFVCSSDFLYVPVAAAHIGASWGEVPTSSDTKQFRDSRDLSVFNAEVSKQGLLESYSRAGADEPRQLDAGHAAQLRFHSQRGSAI